tara:strand:+ start:154 stop:744 length:591 start_codon:yes stop_codon:yes gene_type:complete
MTASVPGWHHRSYCHRALIASAAPPAQIRLPRRGMERLDLLLLAIEALDLHGSEAMVWSCQQLELKESFPDRVALWKSRCRNPLRRASRRGELSLGERQGLIELACMLSERLYPMLRQLLSSNEPEELNRQRWGLFRDRYNELVRERMNGRRGAIRQLLDPEQGEELRRDMVLTLAFCAGPGGVQRLEASLLDGSR